MGFATDGYVLRPARIASGNATSTGEATTGVDRDHIEATSIDPNIVTMDTLGYDILPSRPVEPYADMYRAGVLLKPDSRTGTEEYVIWAATTGSLSTVNTDAFRLLGDPDFVTPAVGSLTVGAFEDGTDTLFVADAGGRDLYSIETLTLVRGDNGAFVDATFTSQDALTGRVVLDGTTLTALGGGFSLERGDTVFGDSYILAGASFWWSRNDQDALRFGWDGKNQRWAPYQGSTPQQVGEVNTDGDLYKLSVPVTRFEVGDVLPGTPGSPEEYALMRAGVYPDSVSTPLNVLVVSDADTEGDYPALGAAYDAVVGVTNGAVLLNPTWAGPNAGLTLWYNAESFRPDYNGDLGSLGDLPTDSNLGFPALSPVPGPTERPFVRLGFRRYLTPIAVDTDADLPSLPSGVTERSFYWSRATGKIVLSDVDIKRAQPGEAEYDIAYLEARVFYDGVSLTTQPLTLHNPTPLVNSSGDELVGSGTGVPGTGDVFIQKATPLPPPGSSGVLYVPDGTGKTPDLSTAPDARSNGSGLVRKLRGVGDSFVFASSKAFENLEVEEYEEDIPKLKIKVAKNEVVTSLQPSTSQPTGFTDTSRCQLKRRGIQGEALYFIQAQATPAVYSEEARLYSRFGEDYEIAGTEVLTFAIDGTTYTWTTTLAAGAYSAADIVASLISDTSPALSPTSAGVVRGRVFLSAADPDAGSVEIGWNADPDDLSGHAALGFLPAWRVATPSSTFRWQPDNGASIGLYRSPENLDRAGSVADIKAVEKFDSEVLTDSIPGTPFYNINNPPLEDLPGYDDGVHFITVLGFNIIRLSNYGVQQGVGVKYEWQNDRLVWTEVGEDQATEVLSPTDSLQLANVNVLPETFSSEAMASTGDSYGLYLKNVTTYTELVLGDDFLLPGNGGPGVAALTSPEGGQVASGGGGEFSSGGDVFSNPSLSPDPTQNLELQTALYNSVEPGYILEILNGDAIGFYHIVSKALVGGIAEFTVNPTFAAAGVSVSWRIYEAQETGVFDPTVIADVQQVVFNHLPDEPFKIRVLSSVGSVGSSPLTAVVVDALSSGRATSIRFGLTNAPAPEASISYLEAGSLVGTLAETGLVVPDTGDQHFTDSGATAYFQVRIGASEYNTTSANLSLVSAFSGTIPAGTIEVGEDGSGIEGELGFADDILSGQAGEQVYYDQLFLDPASLAAGTAEIDPRTGEVSLAAADVTTYSGLFAYFVEQMITEDSLDVTMSPLNGSILFNKPLREFQVVEVSYQQANTDGSAIAGEIIEFLPLVVRLEEGTVVDNTTYDINPTGRTLDLSVEPFIWAGVELQNYAGTETATVNPDSTVTFATAVPSGDTVKVNYGVLEAFGGEQAYTVSSFPVYRPPFFLVEEQDTFTLETDRTSDIGVGDLVVLGPVPLYVKAVAYDAGADETTVTLWPPPLTEVGSRAPGKDAAFTVSSVPVAIEVDPDSPVAGGGAEGFLLLVDTSATGTPLLPADRGQTEFAFLGDLRHFARAGHLLEVAGFPHLIVGANLTDDGRYTVISVSNPIYEGIDSSAVVRISARPVYIPSPVEFSGVSAFVEEEGFTLVLFDATGLGRALTEGVHYEVDAGTGDVTFKSPSQPPLQPGETLQAFYSARNPIGPIVVNDAIISPFYKAKYLHIATPSDTNRLLGSILQAKYTYKSPDSFYFETTLLTDYLGEVAKVALSKVNSSSRSGGAVNAFPGVPDNSTQGALGLRAEVHDLNDQDRAARAFIELYNGVVLSFEQVLEAIDGRVIGDRDGKFRFFVGHDKRYAPPGFEDQITGDISQRLVWREIVDEWADETDLADGYYEEEDPVFDPTTAEEKDPVNRPGETDGKTPNPHTLDFYAALQRTRIKNDMDDRLLIGFGRPRGLALLFPGINVPGIFKDMWQPHVFSRLFPERTKHFTRLFPGLEAVQDANGGFTDVGYYSPGRKITVDGPEPGEETEQTIKTRKSPIGVIANPAIGNITGVVDVTAEDRLPRARVWAYYPEGDAGLDAALGTTTVGKATLVATPLSMGEFPIEETTGFPDTSQLISNAGSLYDLASGDVDLSTPGFEPEQQLQFGTPAGPTGTTYALTDGDGNGIFIEEVLEGCVLTLADKDGSSITGDSVFVLDTTPLSDIVSDGTGRGDTVFVGATIMNLDDVPEDADSPTLEQIAELALSIPDYRVQFDLKVGKRTGQFLDNSLAIRDDKFPLPLRNMFGQKPPSPMTAIEGTVEFVNTSRSPLKLPCLEGLPNDDSGDLQIPYLSGTDTELSVLGQVAAEFLVLLGSDSSVGLPYVPPGSDAVENQVWAAIYPDEIVTSGSVYQTSTTGPDRDPATLYSDADVTPVLTAGSYTADSAIGDLRRWDLLLVEVNQAQVIAGEWFSGMTGILTVGDTSGYAVNTDHSKIEPPRFVTPTLKTDLCKYTVTNAYGYLSGTFPATAGVIATNTGAGPPFFLTLDFSSVGGMFLDDGTGGGTGGVLALIPGNALVINFYDPDPAAGSAYLGSIVLPSVTAGATIYMYDPAGPTISTRILGASGVTLTGSDILVIQTAGGPIIPNDLPLLATGTYYDFTITMDTYIDANTSSLTAGPVLAVGSGVGSTTAEILRDRLTLSEEVSFGTALPRGSVPANSEATALGVSVNVQEVTCDGTAGMSVNEATEVNGGSPFTIQGRIGPDVDGLVTAGVPYVGTFDTTTSIGKLRMMGWEGHGNTPLPFTTSPTTGITISAAPSSDLGDSAVILTGTGTMRDDTDGASTTDGTFAWIETDPGSDVEAGDIVVVDGAGSGVGAVNAGTYLARHTVATNTSTTAGVDLLEGTFPTKAGFRDTLDLTFPTVKSVSGLTLVMGGVAPVTYTGSGCVFKTTGFVYLIRKDEYSTYDAGISTYTIIADSVYRMAYTGLTYDAATGEATVTLTTATAEDAATNGLSDDVFKAAATTGTRCSGFTLLPMSPIESTGLPSNNTVGWFEDDIGAPNDLTAGVKRAVLGNTNPANHTDGGTTVAVVSKVWDKVATPTDVRRLMTDVATPTGTNNLGVRVPNPEDNTDFYADRTVAIYGRQFSGGSTADPILGTITHLSIEDVDHPTWENIHFDSSGGGGGSTVPAHTLDCLLPGDLFIFASSLTSTTPGFFALSGIFLEPSFPRPTTDLNLADPHVVAASWPLTGQTTQVGHRNFSDFEAAPTTYTETVHFYVRRIRRWHGVQADIAGSLDSLKYAYEMRKGIFGSYSSGDRKLTASTSFYGAATNLGAFDDPLVNINAGDVLRVLDADGNLIDSAEVQVVVSSTVVQLRKPGLTASLGAAVSFEVYLEQAIVPHEQSNQQLFDLVTDKVVVKRVVDYPGSATDGGSANDFNLMQDNLIASWAAAGVQEGDYVVIDPAGELYDPDEFGSRPIGDQSIDGRASYVAGKPSDLDDNRGFYRVASLSGGDLEVDGASRFGGGSEDASDDVVLGDGGSGSEYAVLPTIHDSTLTRPSPGPFPGTNREGQQALRPTAPAVGGKFKDRTGDALISSIQPFAYRIIRPSPIFSEDALELILFIRERMLSFIEEAQSVYKNGKGGDYYVFQRDDHIEDVGSPTDPGDGLGVVSNGLITSLQGLVGVTPYANTSDCLSVLGRRFWVLDLRLDSLGYTDFVDDGFGQRPVLPDLIDDVLNLDDRFRDMRYSWISFRADQVNGSITTARRAKEQLPVELQKQRELVEQKRALDTD